MENIIIEIRAAEGGKDSKLLVEDLRDIYLKVCKNRCLEHTFASRDGFTSIWINSKKAFEIFKNEIGPHRWLRIPPTEKRGRIQTSIITVAIINPNGKESFNLDRSEVTKSYIRSSGSGGQNVNKRSTCVQLTHIPTGIQIKCQDERDQKKNEELAWKRLEDKLRSIEDDKYFEKFSKDRFEQIGLGDRSEKKRSYRLREDIVIDHETGKQCSFKDFSRGKIEILS